MKNKTIANWIIGTIATAFFIAFFIEPSDYALAETLYTFDGLALFTFGIIAVVRLYKLND